MTFIYWLGLIFFVLPFLAFFGGPERDRRFKTGYKNNEEPLGALDYLLWIFVAFVVGFGLMKIANYIEPGVDFIGIEGSQIINYLYIGCLAIAIVALYFQFFHNPKKKNKNLKTNNYFSNSEQKSFTKEKTIATTVNSSSPNSDQLYFHPANSEYLNLIIDLKLKIEDITKAIESQSFDPVINNLIGNTNDIKQIVKKDYIDALCFIDPSIGNTPSKDAFAFFYLFSNEDSYKECLIYGMCLKDTWSLMRKSFIVRENPFKVLHLLAEIKFPYLEKYIALLNQIAFVLCKSDGIILFHEQKLLKKLRSITSAYASSITITKVKSKKIRSKKNLDALIEEMNSLIGLSNVKEEVISLINFLKIQTERSKRGLKNIDLSLHYIFKGPPGTGKTTVARILSEIYFELGILKENKLIETDRSGLVAEYIGQTAIKTNKIIDTAMNGILFIDEAYMLYNKSGNDFGREAIGVLLKKMEDQRKNLGVIMAGYEREMDELLTLNPGLESRINRQINFEEFKLEELYQIFLLICSNSEYELDQPAKIAVTSYINYLHKNRTETFGNAREMRNLFEECIENHAMRLGSKTNINSQDLVLLTIEDIPMVN